MVKWRNSGIIKGIIVYKQGIVAPKRLREILFCFGIWQSLSKLSVQVLFQWIDLNPEVSFSQPFIRSPEVQIHEIS